MKVKHNPTNTQTLFNDLEDGDFYRKVGVVDKISMKLTSSTAVELSCSELRYPSPDSPVIKLRQTVVAEFEDAK